MHPETVIVDDVPVSCWHVEEGEQLVPGVRAWSLLGAGKRFESWLGWSDALHYPVVIKIARPARADEPSTPALLAREADAHGHLAHPGLQRLLQAVLDVDHPYLVLEFVEGATLDRVVAEEGPFDPVDVAAAGAILAATLTSFHERGYAHLDVKPGNVVLRDERPVVLDLGITRPLGVRRPPGETRGSPPYCSPEQWGDEPAHPLMDAYGLGTTLYQLATGSRAYDPVKVDGRWVRPEAGDRARPVQAHDPTFPTELACVIDAMVHPDHRNRLSVADALPRLDDFVARSDVELWPRWVLGRRP